MANFTILDELISPDLITAAEFFGMFTSCFMLMVTRMPSMCGSVALMAYTVPTFKLLMLTELETSRPSTS